MIRDLIVIAGSGKVGHDHSRRRPGRRGGRRFGCRRRWSSSRAACWWSGRCGRRARSATRSSSCWARRRWTSGGGRPGRRHGAREQELGDGAASSLRTGLDGLRLAGRIDAAITLVDMPGMTTEALAALASRAAPDALAVATYDGVRSHPVLLGRDHWAGVIETATGDEGARRYLAAHEVTEVDCTGLADPTDLDVPPSPAVSALSPPSARVPSARDRAGGGRAALGGRARGRRGRQDRRGRRLLRRRRPRPRRWPLGDRAGVRRPPDGGRRDRRAGRGVSPPAPTCTPSPSPTGSGCWASATSPWRARSARLTAARRSPRVPSSSTKVKKRLPIWKRQVFTDGEEEWVACPWRGLGTWRATTGLDQLGRACGVRLHGRTAPGPARASRRRPAASWRADVRRGRRPVGQHRVDESSAGPGRQVPGLDAGRCGRGPRRRSAVYLGGGQRVAVHLDEDRGAVG